MTRKIIPTQEMLDDLSGMGDTDYCVKWGVSRRITMRLRRDFGIKSFNNQHGTREHKIENDLEYKWCQKGHWEAASEFGVCRSRYDGLRCYCKFHSRLEGKKHYLMCNKKEKAVIWRHTENGKISLRNTWRKQAAKRKEIYVSWTRDDEERIYAIFDGRCAYCSKQVLIEKMEFDHFIPIVMGGKTEPSNMMPCCTVCNHGKEGKFTSDALEWLIVKFGAHRGNMIYQDILQEIEKLKTVVQ